jgi:protein involved in temperature-dependent protein secretion
VAQESGRSEERIEALRAALAASQEDKDELNEKRELQLDEVGRTFGLLSLGSHH